MGFIIQLKIQGVLHYFLQTQQLVYVFNLYERCYYDEQKLCYEVDESGG